MDIKTLSLNIGIDVETYRKLLGIFYARTKEDMELIANAIHNRDSDGALRGGHSIKGSAGNLAITDIYDMATEIENKARIKMYEEIPPIMAALQEKLELINKTLLS